jgi:hypothetical protein
VGFEGGGCGCALAEATEASYQKAATTRPRMPITMGQLEVILVVSGDAKCETDAKR